MGTRTLTDRGANVAEFSITREGADSSVRVSLRTDDGGAPTAVMLSLAEVNAALTAGEMAGLKAVLAKLYQAALTKAGFTE